MRAPRVLEVVLEVFGDIWPGRHTRGGASLGDTWPHPAAQRHPDGPDDPSDGLVPFHKLSQWLTYSLLEPIEDLGREVTDLGGLTGLAEYRNGGLFIDLGMLAPIDADVFEREHATDDELIVEWRALTVALLDRVHARALALLNLDAEAFPLARLLQGGTWAAGRDLARRRRPDGSPPLRLRRDGTAF